MLAADPSDAVISLICAAVRPALITTTPITVTAVEPDTPAASCAGFMPVASMIASPAGVLETSAVMIDALEAEVSVMFSTVVTAAMSAATAAICVGVMPAASIVTNAPPTNELPTCTWSSVVVICVDESGEAMMNEPKIPFAAIWLALSATAASCGLDIDVASTVTPVAPARKVASCDALRVASAIDLAALQANASLASNTVSLSSSASQALPCASLSQFAWLALAVVGQLSLFDATPQAVNGPEPTPSPSTSA